MIARKSFLIALSRVFALGLGFVSWYFVTNHIPNTPEMPYVGSVGSAIAFIGIFAFMTDLGFGTAHIKRVSEGMDLGKCNGTYISIKSFFVLLYIPVILMTIWAYPVFYKPFEHDYDTKLYLIFLLWGVLSNITTMATTTMIARQEIAKSTLMSVASGLVQAIITIVIVYLSSNLFLFAATWVMGAGVSAAIGLFFLSRYPIKRPSLEYFRSYFMFALPLMFGASMVPIQQNIDKVMIKFFMSDDQVGWYWNAQKFANVPVQILIPISVLFLPEQSSLHALGKLKELKEFIMKTERYLSMMILPMTVLVAAVALPFITIMTDIQYSRSAPILIILMSVAVVMALGKPYETQFMGMNKPKYFFYFKLISFPLNIFLNLWLIPESILGIPCLGLGAMGAALATLTMMVIMYIIRRILAYRLMPTGISISVLKQFLAIAVAAAVMFLSNMYIWPITRFYDLAFYGMCGLVIYWSALVFLGEFTHRDMDMIIDVLNVRKMWNYVVGEIRRSR